jgi:hypothetical protein
MEKQPLRVRSAPQEETMLPGVIGELAPGARRR